MTYVDDWHVLAVWKLSVCLSAGYRAGVMDLRNQKLHNGRLGSVDKGSTIDPLPSQ